MSKIPDAIFVESLDLLEDGESIEQILDRGRAWIKGKVILERDIKILD